MWFHSFPSLFAVAGVCEQGYQNRLATLANMLHHHLFFVPPCLVFFISVLSPVQLETDVSFKEKGGELMQEDIISRMISERVKVDLIWFDLIKGSFPLSCRTLGVTAAWEEQKIQNFREGNFGPISKHLLYESFTRQNVLKRFQIGYFPSWVVLHTRRH